MKFSAKWFVTFLILGTIGSGPVLAQWQPTNFFTLQSEMMSSAHDRDCFFVDDETIVTMTLYIYNPINPSFGALNEERPVSNIGGFECRLEFSEGAMILGWNLPPGSTNSGTNEEPLVAFGIPVPVLNDPVALGQIDIYFGGDVSFELHEPETLPCYLAYNVTASVLPRTGSQIPGSVNFTDADDSMNNPLVAGDRFVDEVDYKFTLQRVIPVSTAGETWDALKGLFR
jgi:hypothetical protein